MSDDLSRMTLARATRCKMLVGSFDFMTRGCPCQGPSECRLDKLQRETLRDNPRVVEACERNQAEYRHNRVTAAAPTLLDYLEQLAESMDTVLLHQGKYMTPGDFEARTRTVARAKSLINSLNHQLLSGRVYEQDMP